MSTASWADEYMTMIEGCEAREQRMSDWERGFIASVKSQLTEDDRITPRQIETLERIWERVTSKG